MAKTTAFDRQAPVYDAWFEKNDGMYQAELKLCGPLFRPTAMGWKSVRQWRVRGYADAA